MNTGREVGKTDGTEIDRLRRSAPRLRGEQARRRMERRRKPKEARSPADPAKIDRAVAFINERARAIRSEILAIGEYLLREFFDGDPQQVTDRNPRKMNSFRDLAARKDLLLSRQNLWRAVQLAIQERTLGTVPAPGQLTPSHKAELLGLDDLEEKREVAKKAATEGWTTRRLREEVQKKRTRSGNPPARRSNAQASARDERAIDHATRAVTRGSLAPDNLDDLGRADLERIAGKLQTAVGRIGGSLTAALRLLAELRGGETKRKGIA